MNTGLKWALRGGYCLFLFEIFVALMASPFASGGSGISFFTGFLFGNLLVVGGALAAAILAGFGYLGFKLWEYTK